MAVMYSKLGGCLGVTAKLGSFSQNRPLSWCQGFVGKVNDPLRVGFLHKKNTGVACWGSGGGVVFPGDGAILQGRLGYPCLEECLQPCLTDLVRLLDWPAWGELVAWGKLLPSLGGRRAVAWEALLPSPEGRWAMAWEELLPSPKGRWAVAGGELLPLPRGRWAIAGELGGMPDAWLLAWGMLLPLLGGRRAVAGGELLPSPGGRWAIAREPNAWLLAGVELLAWEVLLTSLAPAWLLVWVVLLHSLGGRC